MQMMITTGILLSNIVNEIVKNDRTGWRITNGVSAVPPVIVMLGIFFVPESPRWMFSHKGKEAAEATLKRLRQTDNVQIELDAIGEQIRIDGNEAPWSALLERSLLKRVGITMFLQVLQQATGINAMFLFGPLIFKDISGQGVLSTLFLSAVNFVSTIPAMRWVDTTGRRKLLLLGAAGMVVGHLVSGITFVAACHGDTNKTTCSKFAGYFIVVWTAFFVFNFAISWGPVCWVYSPEVFPLHVRSKAVSLSTMANWLMAIVMTQVVKLYSPLGIDGVYFLFAVTCACCGVFVYFFCPETKGLLLEDIEALFGAKTAAAEGESPKYEPAETPAQEA
jgi:sugar porter (SP) family MFS transporter